MWNQEYIKNEFQTSMSYVEICKWNGKVVPYKISIPSDGQYPFQFFDSRLSFFFSIGFSLPVELFQFDTIRLQIQIFICLAHFSIKMCQNLHLTFHWHVTSSHTSQGCWPKNANYMSCLPKTLNSWWNLIKQIALMDAAWSKTYIYHFKHFREAKKSQKDRQKT